MLRTFTVSTRKDKASAEVQTVLTIDTAADASVIEALAIQSAIIKRQAHWRKHGIPIKDTVKLSDMAPGKRQAAAPMTKENMVEQVKTFSPEDRAELLRLLQATK